MAKINQLKLQENVNNVLLNAIKNSVESKVALYANKKDKNGLFSPFLFGEFLFWEDGVLPKISKVVDTINHFNSMPNGIELDGARLRIFVIPFNNENTEAQNIRCYLTTDDKKFSQPVLRAEKAPKSDNQKLSDRLAKILADFDKVLSKADQALLTEMAERYKA